MRPSPPPQAVHNALLDDNDNTPGAVWIGLAAKTASSALAALGSKASTPYWVDTSAVDFTLWADSQPDGKSGACAAVHPQERSEGLRVSVHRH